MLRKNFFAGKLLHGPLAATILSMNIWYTGIMTGVEGIGQGRENFFKGITFSAPSWTAGQYYLVVVFVFD
jgi:hypothetical protein